MLRCPNCKFYGAGTGLFRSKSKQCFIYPSCKRECGFYVLQDQEKELNFDEKKKLYYEIRNSK